MINYVRRTFHVWQGGGRGGGDIGEAGGIRGDNPGAGLERGLGGETEELLEFLVVEGLGHGDGEGGVVLDLLAEKDALRPRF